MLIVIWKLISQCGPWVLPFNTPKSLHHLLPCASGYTSSPDLGKAKLRAHKALNLGPMRLILPPSHLRWSAECTRNAAWRGWFRSFILSCTGPLPLLLLFFFFDLEGKDRIQCQDVSFMVQILGVYLSFDSWRSYDTFHQLRIWSMMFCDTATIKKALLSCFFSCS